MQILHICTPSNYAVTKTFIKFVNSEFDSKKHQFLILDKYNNVPDELKEYENVTIMGTYSVLKLINIMYRVDKILLHSLNKTYFQGMILLNPKLIEKIFWIAWGADLYQWKINKKSVKYLIRNNIAHRVRIKISKFVGIFPPDIDYFKKEFKTDATTYYASYVGNLYNPLYHYKQEYDNLDHKIKYDETINIQIGHSSSKILNHVETLKSLGKYKNQNIKVYLPLNYGDMNYGDFVELEAKKIFGEKVECIREMMPKEEYMQYLSTIDIAIFNTTRQIGLGNISPMLYMNKKIFMPEDSVMYNFYRSQNIDIWDYNKIRNLSFDEFRQPLKYKNGKKYITENELNLEHKIEMWNKVFKA